MDNKSKFDLNVYEYLQSSINIKLWVKSLFVLSLLLILTINIVYSKSPILDQHAFRQTQTAISAFYIKKEGFSLAYQTPVIGKSWSIPFEFPIYQTIVAGLSSAFDVSLTQTGKLVSLFFALMTCIPIYRILRSANINDESIYFCLALYLSSPIYLFWSGTFMIESTALFFTVSFLYYFTQIFCGDRSNFTLLKLAFFLTLALLQKATTPLPVLMICIFVYFGFGIKIKELVKRKLYLLKLILSVLLPIIICLIWVKFTDMQKMHNPIGRELTSSALKGWNYGSFQQRISEDLWWNTIIKRNIFQNGFFLFGVFFIFYALCFLKDVYVNRILVLTLSLFIVPFFIFTNLHVRHNYYQVANVIFMNLTLGISTIAVCEKYLKDKRLFYALIVTSFIIFNFGKFFFGEYYASKSADYGVANNRTLQLSTFIKSYTPKDSPIVILGYDWSSEIAFYSERKALTLPIWPNIYAEVIEFPEHFLGDDKPSTYILCPLDNKVDLESSLEKKYPEAIMKTVADCDVYLLK